MATNRPLFDDEDLPDWLKAGGISYGGQPGQSRSQRPGPSPSAAQPSTGSDDMSWLNEEPDFEPLPETPTPSGSTLPWLPEESPVAPPDGALPWLQDSTPAQPAPSTGDQLPWESAPAAPGDASFGAPPWESAPATPGEVPFGAPPWEAPRVPDEDLSQVRTGVTGMLPWRQEPSGGQPVNPADDQNRPPWEEPPAPQVPPQPTTPGPAFDNLDWLNAAPSQQPEEAQPTTPEPAFDNLDWLNAAPSQQPAAPEPLFDDSWLDAPPEPPKAQPAPGKPLKKLPAKPDVPPAPVPSAKQTPSMAPPPVAPPPAPQVPPMPAVSEPDLSNMTYEEWEQAQIAKEQEAMSDPADKLLDEVPEWFSQAGATPPQPAAPSGPEFMPDWYMGMEEQSPDAAPDWFNSADLSSTSLAGPETIQTPSAEAGTEPAPADEVPDWFTGAGTEGMDFDAMFSGPAPEPPTPAPAVPPVPPAAPEPVSAEPEPLDWMTETPDLASWTPAEQGTPAEPEEPEAVESNLPPWMSGMEPISANPPRPEDASPDLDALWEANFSQGSDAPQSGLPPAEETPFPSAAQSTVTESPAQADFDALFELPGGAMESENPFELEQPEAGESDVPAWMRDMAPISANPPRPEDASPELDWLSEADFEMPAGTPPAAQPAAPITPPPAAQPVSAQREPAPSAPVDLNAAVDIDDLLGLSGEEYTPSAAPVIPVDTGKQALARLDDFDLDALLGPKEEESFGKQGAEQEIDLDDLAGTPLPPAVREGTGEPAEPPRAGRLRRVPGTPTPTPTAETPRPREELPEWLEEMRPSEMPVSLHIGDQEVRIQEKPVVQMNDRLRQLRDQGKPFHDLPIAAPAPPSGPLSGVSGAIQTIPEVIQPGTVSIPMPLTAAESQTRRVKIIQQMLTLEDAMFRARATADDEEKPVTAPRPRVKIDRYIVTLLLAVAVIVPFFVNGLNIIPAPALDRLTPVQSSVAKVVDTIQAQQPVLVAFEYGPTAAGELDDLARTILRDIVKRGGRPVIVSTNPVGAMRAQLIMAMLGSRAADLQLMNRPQPLVNRQDYVVLRYLAGGSVGARSIANAILTGGFEQQVVFSTDIEGKPSGLTDISGLKTSPAFVLAETADDVRNWAEQYQAPTGEKPFSIVFLTSASASPVAESYVRSAAQTDQHLVGPLVGLRDTMTYQAVRQPSQSAGTASASTQQRAEQRWQSIGLSALLAGVIILVGMTLNMIRGLQRRRRR